MRIWIDSAQTNRVQYSLISPDVVHLEEGAVSLKGLRDPSIPSAGFTMPQSLSVSQGAIQTLTAAIAGMVQPPSIYMLARRG